MARSEAAVSVCEIGVAGAGTEDDDAPFLEVADGTALDVRFSDRTYFDAGHHRAGDSHAFQRILERQRIHDGRQHAHVVGSDPFHAMVESILFPTPKIASPTTIATCTPMLTT
jgi:hypothetical protein